MEKPQIDLNPVILYLREKCGKETYAKQVESAQEFLHYHPPLLTADQIEVEEILCHSILISARQMLEALFTKPERMSFIELTHRVVTEVRVRRSSDVEPGSLFSAPNVPNEDLTKTDRSVY